MPEKKLDEISLPEKELEYKNPYIEGGDPAFIDSLLTKKEAGETYKKILKIADGAENSALVLQEKSRRATNRSNLIKKIALGEFVPDLKYATYIYELLANKRFGLINFNLNTLFPAVENQEEIKEYLSRFRVPRQSHPDIPDMSFPMSLGVWGKSSELDDFLCGTYRSIEHLKKGGKEGGEKRKYFLTSWDQDLERHYGSIGYKNLLSLPVLEDPEVFKFNQAGVLEDLDSKFANKLLEYYRQKIGELRQYAATFKTPLIKRLLILMPASRKREEYSLEFLPQIKFPANFQPVNQRFTSFQPAYDPYALVDGTPNNCANYLQPGSLGSNERIKFASKENKEAMLSIDSFGNMNTRDRIEATMKGTVEGEFMGNRLGIILLPGEISKKISSADLPTYKTESTFDPSSTYAFSTNSEKPVTIYEASVSIGTQGDFSAEKKYSLHSSDQVFYYQQGGQPIMYMIRYVTVLRPE